MSDAPVDSGGPAGPATAGRLIREARQAQGLHIAALAASIKVTQRKLELLEADRLDELPDATFARALAQTVCKSLKIDPAPVLALLPQLGGGNRLEHVSVGINAPFRDKPGRHEPHDWSDLASPAVLAPVLVLVAAAVLYLLPAGWFSKLPTLSLQSFGLSASGPFSFSRSGNDAAPAPTATGDTPGLTMTPETAASSVVETVFNAAPPDGAASVAPSAASPAGPLQLRANSETWVEVLDAQSQILLSRMLQPGETVVLDGTMPFKLKIGNAAGTEVMFRGQPVNLAASTRDNVARLQLK